MATFPIYLEAPLKGESPFVDVVTPTIAGNDQFKIFAGRLENEQHQHWAITRGIIYLTTSADVANRLIIAKQYSDFGQGNIFVNDGYVGSVNIAASSTGAMVFSKDRSNTGLSPHAGTTTIGQIQTCEEGCLFKGIDYWQFQINNGQAADLFYAVMTFKYLNYELGIEFKS